MEALHLEEEGPSPNLLFFVICCPFQSLKRLSRGKRRVKDLSVRRVRWASKISAGEILIGESRHNPDVSRTSSDQPQHSTNNRSSCAAPSCGLELRKVEFCKVTSLRTRSKQPKSPLDAVLSDFQVYTLPLSLIKPVCFSQPYSLYVTLKRDQENPTFPGEGLKAH